MKTSRDLFLFIWTSKDKPAENLRDQISRSGQRLWNLNQSCSPRKIQIGLLLFQLPSFLLWNLKLFWKEKENELKLKLHQPIDQPQNGNNDQRSNHWPRNNSRSDANIKKTFAMHNRNHSATHTNTYTEEINSKNVQIKPNIIKPQKINSSIHNSESI